MGAGTGGVQSGLQQAAVISRSLKQSWPSGHTFTYSSGLSGSTASHGMPHVPPASLAVTPHRIGEHLLNKEGTLVAVAQQPKVVSRSLKQLSPHP